MQRQNANDKPNHWRASPKSYGSHQTTHVNEREPQIHGNYQTQRSSPPKTDQLRVTINLETRSTADRVNCTACHKSFKPSFPQRFCEAVANLPSALARALSKILSPPTNPSPAMRLASESHLGLGSVKVPNSTSTNSLTDLDATINQSTPPE